jgi:hypothetical protein
MSDITSKDVRMAAKAALNPQGVAVGIAWSDPKQDRVHVYAHFNTDQRTLDKDYLVEIAKEKPVAMGSGTTIGECVDQIERKFFGGL